jgi:hypothetical protein
MWSCSQWWNLSPMGEVIPLRAKTLSAYPFVLLNSRGPSSPLRPSSPLGAKLSPGGKVHPGGQVHPWGPSSPQGAKFTPGGQVHPWGPSSPQGAKFTPGGQVHPKGPSSRLAQTHVVKNWPQVIHCFRVEKTLLPLRALVSRHFRRRHFLRNLHEQMRFRLQMSLLDTNLWLPWNFAPDFSRDARKFENCWFSRLNFPGRSK